MRLAEDEITVTVGREVIRLRASLRAAMRLERRYNGFNPILRSIANSEVGVIAAVIAETSVAPTLVGEVLEQLSGWPLHQALEELVPAASAIVMQLVAGEDTEASDNSAKRSSPVTFAEFHMQLYRIATGWLGWSPEQAWAATPAEIIEAHKGRIDLLGSIFGTNKPKATGRVYDPADDLPDPDMFEKIRELASMGRLKAA